VSPDNAKVGVFICHCGKNIAGVINVEEVRRFAEKLPGVVVAKDYMFMCSQTGQRLIKDAIKEHRLNRVVVASCSPKLHEPTFRKCISEAGLNPYLLEMVNLREHCSWPHLYEPGKATEKAKALLKAAVERAKRLEPVKSVKIPVIKSVLVIGGGVAGIQAALDLAEQGFRVYLVERSPSIGGNMARVVKTFPTDDCAMCILSPKMSEVASHPNITLFTCSEVISVDGHVGNFTVRILKRPRHIDEEKCVACGACEEVCPVLVPDEFDLGMRMRKAIYIPFPQAIPRVYLIDTDKCIRCGMCAQVCERNAINFDEKPKELELKVGAIIVATGFEEFDPSPITEYGYGEYDNVVTQMQLARMLDPLGPTHGEILRADGKPAKTIVMIQCVGSRDHRFNKYCSSVCCMVALKHAQLIKLEHDPQAEVYICCIDIRAYRKGYEEYADRARELGVKIIKGRVSKVEEDKKSGKLKVYVYNVVLDEVMVIDADLVVLSSAMIPSRGTQDLAKILGVEVGPDGFLKELHPKLQPIDTKIPGIFICGCAQGPKDIPDSVAQGSAAAARAASLLSRGEITIDLIIPEVNEDLCRKCGICVRFCPFNALELPPEGKSVRVIELKCKGCGTCAAACPTGAIQLKHYKDEQILAQIEGILGV